MTLNPTDCTKVTNNAGVLGRKHFPELDALRGVAAFVVVLNHFHQVWLGTNHPSWLSRPRLNPLIWLLVDGHASVIVFFLLSGFVLTLPKLRGSSQPYPQFALRRVCRIYPPYAVAILFSVAACSFFYGSHVYGPAVSELWHLRPDLHSVLQHLAMLGRFDVYRYNVPVWSLVHEMRISLIFPLILFCALRLRAATTFAVAAACGIAASFSLWFVETGLPGEVRIIAWSFTLSYCGTFLLGSGLARRHEAATRLLERLGLGSRVALFCGALMLYLYPPPAWRAFDLSDFFIACGGLVLLTFCLRIHGSVARVLRLRPLQFLGRISYSLYLTHFPVLLALAYLSHGRVPFGWVLLPYLAVALAVAGTMYRMVEQPSMQLGKRLSRFRYPRMAELTLSAHRSPHT